MKCDSNKNQSCLARCCHSTTYRTQGRSPNTITHKADIAHPLNKSDKMQSRSDEVLSPS